MSKKNYKTIDEYIANSPKESQSMLESIRTIIKKAAPLATENIKWGYPVFEEKRILFSFSAFKDHINFMPTGPSLLPFKNELKLYKTGKDTVQFPYNKPIPKELVKKIVEHRVKEVREKDAKWIY